MGFFDTVKKGFNMADDSIKKLIAKKSDSELREMDSSNKYVREELQKRGL